MVIVLMTVVTCLLTKPFDNLKPCHAGYYSLWERKGGKALHGIPLGR